MDDKRRDHTAVVLFLRFSKPLLLLFYKSIVMYANALAPDGRKIKLGRRSVASVQAFIEALAGALVTCARGTLKPLGITQASSVCKLFVKLCLRLLSTLYHEQVFHMLYHFLGALSDCGERSYSRRNVPHFASGTVVEIGQGASHLLGKIEPIVYKNLIFPVIAILTNFSLYVPLNLVWPLPAADRSGSGSAEERGSDVDTAALADDTDIETSLGGTEERPPRHWLAELIMSHIFIAVRHPEQSIRKEATTIFRKLLVTHSYDSALGTIEWRQRIAAMYIPLVSLLLQECENKPDLNDTRQLQTWWRGNDCQIDFFNMEEKQDLFVCVAYILRNAPPSLLRAYWRRNCRLSQESGTDIPFPSLAAVKKGKEPLLRHVQSKQKATSQFSLNTLTESIAEGEEEDDDNEALLSLNAPPSKNTVDRHDGGQHARATSSVTSLWASPDLKFRTKHFPAAAASTAVESPDSTMQEDRGERVDNPAYRAPALQEMYTIVDVDKAAQPLYTDQMGDFPHAHKCIGRVSPSAFETSGVDSRLLRFLRVLEDMLEHFSFPGTDKLKSDYTSGNVKVLGLDNSKGLSCVCISTPLQCGHGSDPNTRLLLLFF
jgi:hypothetical protein